MIDDVLFLVVFFISDCSRYYLERAVACLDTIVVCVWGGVWSGEAFSSCFVLLEIVTLSALAAIKWRHLQLWQPHTVRAF